jgi:fatty-acyl-CoA synthase
MFSGPKDPAETLTWTELHAQVTQAANLFRALGVGPRPTRSPTSCPIATRRRHDLLGGAVAGIANPINPLLEPEQIAAILRETNAKVVVTLKPFPKTDVAQKVAEAVERARTSRRCSRSTCCAT